MFVTTRNFNQSGWRKALLKVIKCLILLLVSVPATTTKDNNANGVTSTHKERNITHIFNKRLFVLILVIWIPNFTY